MTAADITANRHRNNPESVAANPTAVSKAARRARVLELIAAEGDWGATSDEIEQATGWAHQSVSARFSELKRDACIQQSGRRPTRSGRTAAVYVAVPVQPTLWAAS